MGGALSPRLRAIVDGLPLRPGMRILEIGCGPGAACREIARRIGAGYVLGIDRSVTAIQQALASSTKEMAAGILEFRQLAAEDFQLSPDEQPFDLVFAVRVGALDGRHPEAGRLAMERIRAALSDCGEFWVDGERRRTTT
jgi:cyclopropane fatty-acyl-phospholipid synthase-like methyltransferase